MEQVAAWRWLWEWSRHDLAFCGRDALANAPSTPTGWWSRKGSMPPSNAQVVARGYERGLLR